MTENSDIVQTILQRFILELKGQPSLSYAGHKNLWLDLGWDLAQGDREICNHVEEMLRIIVDNLPEELKEPIWLESWGGKAKMQEILQEIHSTDGDANQSHTADAHDIIQDIFEYLQDSIFKAAETEFEVFQSLEYEEEQESQQDEEIDEVEDDFDEEQ